VEFWVGLKFLGFFFHTHQLKKKPQKLEEPFGYYLVDATKISGCKLHPPNTLGNIYFGDI
jgi:hypothetical protein